jgi:hypothetical protein
MTRALRCLRPISELKPLSATRSGASRVLPLERAGGTSGPRVGLSVVFAEMTSSGLWSMFFGYARSSSLMLCVLAPTTISLQPIRSR